MRIITGRGIYPDGKAYRKAAGVTNIPRKKNRKLQKPRVSRFSLDIDRALRRWWGDAHVTGKLLHGATDEGYDWRGGTPDWPDWVSVEALAQSVGSLTGTPVSKGFMVAFMNMMEVHHETSECTRTNLRGRVIYRRTQRYYNVGVFKDNKTTGLTHSMGDIGTMLHGVSQKDP